MTPGEESQYFSGLWLQRENGKIVRTWKGIDCHELYDQYEVSMMFWEQVRDHKCPDMKNPTPAYKDGEKPVIKIQNPSSYNSGESSSDFMFQIQICDDAKDITGETCKSKNESAKVIDSVVVSTRVQTEFWNTKNFLRNGWEMNSQWTSSEV